MILTVRREWPWGLAFIGDPDAADPIPDTLGGPATVTVQDSLPDDLTLAYDGLLTLPAGRLVVTDPADGQPRHATVSPGTWRSGSTPTPRRIPKALSSS